jgi:formate--tetrahydrofolate ligase
VANLARHVENLGKFGLPVVVGVNHFTSDTEAEFAAIRDAMAKQGVEAISCTHWGDGSAGAEALARAVQQKITLGEAKPAPLYAEGMPLAEKIRTIARQIYRAGDILMTDAVSRRLEGFEKAGFGNVPVCIAKTQYSFTSDPTVMGAPRVSPCRCARCGCRWRWFRRCDLRRHHDHARPAARALGRGIHLREDGEIEAVLICPHGEHGKR